eukprot:gene17548-23872_t
MFERATTLYGLKQYPSRMLQMAEDAAASPLDRIVFLCRCGQCLHNLDAIDGWVGAIVVSVLRGFSNALERVGSCTRLRTERDPAEGPLTVRSRAEQGARALTRPWFRESTATRLVSTPPIDRNMSQRCGYAVDQYSPILTSTGRQKHLNLLLFDRSVENTRTYGWEQPHHGYSLTLSKRAVTAPTTTSKSLDEPAEEPEKDEAYQAKLESRQMALQIRGRRGPAGQFFGDINSTLFEKQPPPSCYKGSSLSKDSYVTMKGRGTASNSGSCASLPPASEYVELSPRTQIAMTQAATLSTAPRPATTGGAMYPAKDPNYVPSWAMPWQTGDRVAGRKVAMSIRSKRTPNGAFAVTDLPKAK